MEQATLYLILKCPKCGRVSLRQNDFLPGKYVFHCYYCGKATKFRDGKKGGFRVSLLRQEADFKVASELVRRLNAPERYYEGK